MKIKVENRCYMRYIRLWSL